MRNKLLCKVLIIGCILGDPVMATFFMRHNDGWHWYQDPKREEIPITSSIDPSAQVKSYQKKLEEKLHAAWLNPTAQNIREYQQLQRDLLDRSERFASNWIKLIYTEPELDHTLKVPVNYKARHIYLDQNKNIVKHTIQELAQEYGLFFFVRRGCPYCEQFMPIVRQFVERYGWEVIVINEDGAPIPGFQHVRADNGLLAQWQVKVVPALFAVDPKNAEVLPLAYGLTSLEEIEQRIVVLRSRREN